MLAGMKHRLISISYKFLHFAFTSHSLWSPSIGSTVVHCQYGNIDHFQILILIFQFLHVFVEFCSSFALSLCSVSFVFIYLSLSVPFAFACALALFRLWHYYPQTTRSTCFHHITHAKWVTTTWTYYADNVDLSRTFRFLVNGKKIEQNKTQKKNEQNKIVCLFWWYRATLPAALWHILCQYMVNQENGCAP